MTTSLWAWPGMWALLVDRHSCCNLYPLGHFLFSPLCRLLNRRHLPATLLWKNKESFYPEKLRRRCCGRQDVFITKGGMGVGYKPYKVIIVLSLFWFTLMSLPYLIEIGGLVQNRRNSIAFAMELRLFCTKLFYDKFIDEFTSNIYSLYIIFRIRLLLSYIFSDHLYHCGNISLIIKGFDIRYPNDNNANFSFCYTWSQYFFQNQFRFEWLWRELTILWTGEANMTSSVADLRLIWVY